MPSWGEALVTAFDINTNSFTTGNDNDAFIARKTITFDGTAGNGAVGTVNAFTITGDAMVKCFAICSSSLTGATATISLGITGNAVGIIASTTATNITTGLTWTDNAPSTTETLYTVSKIFTGTTIIGTVGTANITGGTLKFYALWRPLSVGATVTAA